MDKETLSNYGWIVICVLVLAVMLALASPFGNFIATAIKSTTQGLFDVNQGVLDAAGIQIMEQEFDTMLNESSKSKVPNGFIYTSAMTGEVLGAQMTLPSKLYAGDQLEQTEGDYVYTLMKTGYETLEEAREFYKRYIENATGMTWDEYVAQYDGYTEEDVWKLMADAGYPVTEDAFIPDTNPTLYWAVAVKYDHLLRTQKTYGVICSELLGYSVTDASGAFSGCNNLLVAPELPQSINTIDFIYEYCTNLTHIYLPSNIAKIGLNEIYQCLNLRNITFGGTIEQWNSTVGDVPASAGGLKYGYSEITVTCTDGTIIIPAYTS